MTKSTSKLEGGYRSALTRFNKLHVDYTRAVQSGLGYGEVYAIYQEMKWCFVELDPYASQSQAGVLNCIFDELVVV